MVKVFSIGKIANPVKLMSSMMDSISMAKSMDMGNSHFHQEMSMMDSGLMIKLMVMEYTDM